MIAVMLKGATASASQPRRQQATDPDVFLILRPLQQRRQLGDIGCDAPCLVACELFERRSFAFSSSKYR
jgi:hypothetical protein